MRCPRWTLLLLGCSACQAAPESAALGVVGPWGWLAQARAGLDAGRPALEAGHPTPDAAVAEGGAGARHGMRCEVDADCRAGGRRGTCFTASLAAQYTQSFARCGDAARWREAHAPGTCLFDECSDDPNSCPSGQRCATLLMVHVPERRCLPAECDSDAQCHARGVGHCVAYPPPGRCQHGGWACSYPQDRCAPRDARRVCPVEHGTVSYCAPEHGRFRCVQERVE